jgi:hypothetical protein
LAFSILHGSRIGYSSEQNKIFESQAGQSAMPSNAASHSKKIGQYWPTLAMLALMVLTGYDIYDRHHPGFAWWGWAIAFLVAATLAIIVFVLLQPKSAAAEISGEQIKQIKLAGVLESKAGKADWLANELERVWLVCNKEGATLTRPLGEHELPDNIQFNRHKQLWSWRVEYHSHIGGLKHHAPDFQDTIMSGNPYRYRNIDYLDLRNSLKEHAEALRQLANETENKPRGA